jgi:hypothetical protein
MGSLTSMTVIRSFTPYPQTIGAIADFPLKRLWGSKKPICEGNGVGSLAVSSCNVAASLLKGQSIIDAPICAKQTRSGQYNKVCDDWSVIHLNDGSVCSISTDLGEQSAETWECILSIDRDTPK